MFLSVSGIGWFSASTPAMGIEMLLVRSPSVIPFVYFCRNFIFFYFSQKSIFCHKKLPPLKPILTLPTWGQICMVSDRKPFEMKNFDLGHPVAHSVEYLIDVSFGSVGLSCKKV